MIKGDREKGSQGGKEEGGRGGKAERKGGRDEEMVARFVMHIPLHFANNLRLKVSFLALQQCGILFTINIFFFLNIYVELKR